MLNHIDGDFSPEPERSEAEESPEVSGAEAAVRPRVLRALSELLPEQESSPARLPDRSVFFYFEGFPSPKM